MGLAWGAGGDFNKPIQALGVLRDLSLLHHFQVRTKNATSSRWYRNISVNLA